MFKLFSIREEAARRLIDTRPTVKTIEKIKIVLGAIGDLQKKYIFDLNQKFYAILINKERLITAENEKSKIESSKIKSIQVKEELEPINRNIKIYREAIKDLNQYISKNIFKINTQIDNIAEEITQIIREISKIEHYYLTNLNKELYEQNEIIKKTKIKQNFTVENTKLETQNLSKEIYHILEILKNILQYSEEFEKNDVIRLKK